MIGLTQIKLSARITGIETRCLLERFERFRVARFVEVSNPEIVMGVRQGWLNAYGVFVSFNCIVRAREFVISFAERNVSVCVIRHEFDSVVIIFDRFGVFARIESSVALIKQTLGLLLARIAARSGSRALLWLMRWMLITRQRGLRSRRIYDGRVWLLRARFVSRCDGVMREDASRNKRSAANYIFDSTGSARNILRTRERPRL